MLTLHRFSPSKSMTFVLVQCSLKQGTEQLNAWLKDTQLVNARTQAF